MAPVRPLGPCGPRTKSARRLSWNFTGSTTIIHSDRRNCSFIGVDAFTREIFSIRSGGQTFSFFLSTSMLAARPAHLYMLRLPYALLAWRGIPIRALAEGAAPGLFFLLRMPCMTAAITYKRRQLDLFHNLLNLSIYQLHRMSRHQLTTSSRMLSRMPSSFSVLSPSPITAFTTSLFASIILAIFSSIVPSTIK